MRGAERTRFVRAHRKSVQRWLDDLQAAGLVAHEPERDQAARWWRTQIVLLSAPAPDASSGSRGSVHAAGCAASVGGVATVIGMATPWRRSAAARWFLADAPELDSVAFGRWAHARRAAAPRSTGRSPLLTRCVGIVDF